MKRNLIVLLPLALALLAGCDRHVARQVLATTLFEPATAQFSAFPAPPPPGAHGLPRSAEAAPVICGEVYARQHTGIFTSAKKYLVDRRTKKAAFQSDLMLEKRRYDSRTDWPREAKFLADWQAACVTGSLTYTQIQAAFDWVR